MSLATEAIRVLQQFMNVIIEGPPGTGKTHVVEGLADEWLTATGRDLIGDGTGRYAITLHPSTTYEEFVDGLRFDEGAKGFLRKPGFLLNIISEAEASPDADYVVLLDEINRANIPKVLGDVLLCMEASRRTHFDGTAWAGGMTVTLPYSGDLFSIPDNVFLIGTMNSSDRSIAPLDSALRRRFGFIRVVPIMGSALHDLVKRVEGEEAHDRVSRTIDELTNLNEVLLDCLGPDSMLGHSYVLGWTSTSTSHTAGPSDPLATLRAIVGQQSTTRAFWLEVGGMWGGGENQLDIPDKTTSRRGLVSEFYPMTSAGVTTTKRSATGTQDWFDVHFLNATLVGNTLEYNTGGSNVRMKLQGKTHQNLGVGSLTQQGALTQRIHLWLARPDNTFDFVVLDRSSDNVAALKGVSAWSERTMQGAGGRTYGGIDLAKLAATATQGVRGPNEDSELVTWRYSILPQLVDNVTQLGATDLLDRGTREAWLRANAGPGVEDRLRQFDEFLESLSLSLAEEGYGLGRALSIKETPVGAEASMLTVDRSTPSVDSAEGGDGPENDVHDADSPGE